MCTKCKRNIMLDFKIFRIGIIIYMEELLNFMNTLFCKIDNFIFFIDDKITIFFYLFLHDSLHLCHLALILTSYKLTSKYITQFIKLC